MVLGNTQRGSDTGRSCQTCAGRLRRVHRFRVTRIRAGRGSSRGNSPSCPARGTILADVRLLMIGTASVPSHLFFYSTNKDPPQCFFARLEFVPMKQTSLATDASKQPVHSMAEPPASSKNFARWPPCVASQISYSTSNSLWHFQGARKEGEDFARMTWRQARPQAKC